MGKWVVQYYRSQCMCLNRWDVIWQGLMCVISVALLPWVSQSRRWLGHSPHGSSGRGGQTCTRHQTASRCLSETHDTLPGSAIWCPVPWSCWQPSELLTNTEQWWGQMDGNRLMRARVTNGDARKKVPSKTQRKQKYFQFFLSTNRQRVLLVGVF